MNFSQETEVSPSDLIQLKWPCCDWRDCWYNTLYILEICKYVSFFCLSLKKRKVYRPIWVICVFYGFLKRQHSISTFPPHQRHSSLSTWVEIKYFMCWFSTQQRTCTRWWSQILNLAHSLNIDRWCELASQHTDKWWWYSFNNGSFASRLQFWHK